MFSYSYKYKMDAAKDIIKLTPTLGTYAKAFLPVLVPVLVLWAVLVSVGDDDISVLDALEEDDTTDHKE